MQLVGAYGARYESAIDLSALQGAHKPQYAQRTEISVDGNTAAAIPFLQWWRAPIMAGFPITPSTKWLEHLAAVVGAGKCGKAKRVKLLGLFPCFRKRRGEPGEIKHVPDKAKRPGVEKFLLGQQRFEHLVRAVDGKVQIVPGREAEVAALQGYADRNVQRLHGLAQLL